MVNVNLLDQDRWRSHHCNGRYVIAASELYFRKFLPRIQVSRQIATLKVVLHGWVWLNLQDGIGIYPNFIEFIVGLSFSLRYVKIINLFNLY